MAEWWRLFTLAFVPLFIAIDALGLPPIIITLSEGMTVKERKKMVHIAILTALLVGLAFLFFGQFILTLMGISVGSFAIAGGTILLVQSIRNMTFGRMVDAVKEEMVAVVPIGTPLLAGPATITTLLLLTPHISLTIVMEALVANVLIAWGICLGSYRILKIMGQGGIRAISRVFSLLLASIAVSMILKGLAMSGIIPAAP
ncbi:MAG: MarC family protein [Dehalococcoidia bacterium]|nr:MarC family protein [Dehalococcoidia bacterium]